MKSKKDNEKLYIFVEGKTDKEYLDTLYNKLIKYDIKIKKSNYDKYIKDFIKKYYNTEIDKKTFYTFIQNKIHYDNAVDIFNKNLKYYMDIKGKNTTDLSKDLHISYSTVNDWSNGKNYPRPDKMSLLADYFDISTSDLTEERNTQKVDNSSVIVPVLGRIPARYTS